jgi:hypothetical protein
MDDRPKKLLFFSTRTTPLREAVIRKLRALGHEVLEERWVVAKEPERPRFAAPEGAMHRAG